MNRNQSTPPLPVQILSMSAIILAFISACGVPTQPVLPPVQVAYVYPQTPTSFAGTPTPSNVVEVTEGATAEPTILAHTVTPAATTASPTSTPSPSPTLTPSTSVFPVVETATDIAAPVSTTCTPSTIGTPAFTSTPVPITDLFWVDPAISMPTCIRQGEVRVHITLYPHGGEVPYTFYPSRNFVVRYPEGNSESVYVAARSDDGQQWAAIIELPIIPCP